MNPAEERTAQNSPKTANKEVRGSTGKEMGHSVMGSVKVEGGGHRNVQRRRNVREGSYRLEGYIQRRSKNIGGGN